MQLNRTLIRYSLLGLLVLLSAFTPMIFTSGLTTPVAIDMYLDGAFPSKLSSSVELEEPFSNASDMDEILVITAEPSSTRMHFIRRNGEFYWIGKDGDGSDQTLFMDISGRVWTGQDSGVLGMAFHPDFNKAGNPNRNYFYVFYVTISGNTKYIRLSRFTRTDGTNLADESTEQILIEQQTPGTKNLHRGGGVLFGADGFLYASIGDLGEETQSQNLTDMLAGGVIRIDVDKQGGAISHPVRRTLQSQGVGTTGDYYIPSDNPWLDVGGSLFEEYYTIGNRNPHRMTIDPSNGKIYIGNVGANSVNTSLPVSEQKIYEEVNLVAKGANFGWPYREGFVDRPDLMARPNPIIGTETDPIHDYDHSNGNQWICGGFIYRGTEFPEFSGHYIFGDGASRKIWAMDISGTAPFTAKTEITSAGGSYYTFGQDQDGEIWIGTKSPKKIIPGISGTGIIPNDVYYIRNLNSQKMLSVAGASGNNGANIEQTANTNSSEMQWTVTHLGSGEFQVQNLNSTRSADVQGNGMTPGSTIHQWNFNGSDNQRWKIEAVTGTQFRIVSVSNGYDLQVEGASSADGADVEVSTRLASNFDHQIWEFIPIAETNPISPSVILPELLSETGAFTDLANLTPAAGIIPYDMITSLWSDAAEKARWLAVPNDGTHNTAGEEIIFSEEGEWEYPLGTVFIKHFSLPIDENNPSSLRKLETRFMVHGENGYYAVTYRWRADGSDADLLEDSFEEDITINEIGGGTRQQTWYYPSRSECFACHTEASGRVLGPQTRHLNKDILYPSTGLTGNQIESYNNIGMFDQTLNVGDIPGYLSAVEFDDTSESLEDRARSYLDINCSSCHRPNGGTRATWNALITEDLANANIINGDVIEDLGIAGAKVIVPGDLAKSVLYQRISQVNTGVSMPPLAKNLAHAEGVQLIGDWILSMGATASLSMKVFVEGPYDSGTGTMNDDLRAGSLLSSTDPYGLNTDAAANAFDAAGNNSVVDWIKIELRDESDNTVIVAEKAALVQRDGDVVDKDLNTTLVFDGVAAGSYYVVVKHYNHLGTMTSTAIDLSSGPSIDFSNPSTPLFSNGAEGMNTISGVRALWGGDANSDGAVNAIDQTLNWIPQNGAPFVYGTTTADFDLTGAVNAIDLNFYWRVNNSRFAQLP